MFLDTACFFTAGLLALPQSWDFQKSSAQVGLNDNCYKKDILKECLFDIQVFLVKYGLSILGMI